MTLWNVAFIVKCILVVSLAGKEEKAKKPLERPYLDEGGW